MGCGSDFEDPDPSLDCALTAVIADALRLRDGR